MRFAVILKDESKNERLIEKLQKKGFKVNKGSSGIGIWDLKNIYYGENTIAIEDIKMNFYTLEMNDIKMFDIEVK